MLKTTMMFLFVVAWSLSCRTEAEQLPAVHLTPECKISSKPFFSGQKPKTVQDAGDVLEKALSPELLEKIRRTDVYHLNMDELGDDGFCLANFFEREWLKSKFGSSVLNELRSRGLDGEGFASNALANAIASRSDLDARLKWLASIAYRNKLDNSLLLPPPTECRTDRDSEKRIATVFLYGDAGWHSMRNLHFCVESLEPQRFHVFSWDRGWFSPSHDVEGQLSKAMGVSPRQ